MQHWDSEQRTPLVSIICLTYNHAPYIAEALESFLAQETRFRFEILVNDDASDDGTQDVIRSYAERYPTLIKPIFRKENQYSQGIPYGIQLFALARGSYIAYCEGDGYWTDPLKLQVQVDFLEQNPDYVITYHNSYVFNSSGIVEQQRFQGQDHHDLSALELKQAYPLSTLTVCFRNKIQELPPELYTAKLMDICWWSLLGAYGKGRYLPEIKPTASRIHEGGMRTQQKRLQMNLHTQYCLATYYYRIEDLDLYYFFLGKVFELSFASLPKNQKPQALASILRTIGLNLFNRLKPLKTVY